jgi:hypothetical protein
MSYCRTHPPTKIKFLDNFSFAASKTDVLSPRMNALNNTCPSTFLESPLLLVQLRNLDKPSCPPLVMYKKTRNRGWGEGKAHGNYVFPVTLGGSRSYENGLQPDRRHVS